jgi:hypothetical protein
MPRKDPEARRAYHREYIRHWYQKNRALHIARVQRATAKRRALFQERINRLKEKPCVDCGVWYPPYIMDFDHVAGEKVDDICNLRKAAGWQSILDEIAKCEVVCANCHRARTHFRRLGQLLPDPSACTTQPT